MNAIRLLITIVFILAMPCVALAQDGPGKCPPYGESNRTYDASPIVDAIDRNGDDKMTLEEWMAAEAPEPSWNMFMGKEKVKAQGYITRKDFMAEAAPNGIDTDCDGLITLDEFLATKKWKMGGGPGGPPPGGVTKKRSTVSAGERALAAIEVQNVFSKHCYYHENGLHRAEMEDIWVKKDGKFAKTARWTQPQGIHEGYDAIWDFYVIAKETTLKQNLADISKAYPEIKNVPANLGIGGEWASHVQTTPIIEVAGDGKTAKGIWYSPGLRIMAQVRDGKISKSGGWFWEKYAADFVKEDGKWKIWHIAMYYENTPPGWNADTQSYEAPDGEGGHGVPAAPKPGPETQANANIPMVSRENPNPYEAWSPTKLPRIVPRFPEPYYTFSETFSY